MNASFKYMLIPFFALACIPVSYLVGARYSRHKIDAFCNSIGPKTTVGELPHLAEEAGVEWHPPTKLRDEHGEFLYIVVPDLFTIGEYACRVRGNVETGAVLSRHSGY